MKQLSSLLAITLEQMVPYAAIGVAAIIALIAFIVGAKKGFSGLARRPLSWAFGCAVFIVLEIFLHEILANALNWGAIGEFLATLACLLAALVTRFIVFAGLDAIFKAIFKRQLAEVEKIRAEETETGEFVCFDENKLQKRIPFDGQEKPSATNRFFGGVFAVIIVAVIVGFIASIAALIINVTPLRAQLAFLYENGTFLLVFDYIRAYALDCLLIALLVVIVRGGYSSGLFNIVRTWGIFLAYIAVVGLSFYLPFSPWVQEGQFFHVVTRVVNYVAQLILGFIPADFPVAIPEGVVYGGVKIAFGLVLCLVLCLVVRITAWLFNKLQESIDDSDAACVVDGIFGAAFYFVVGVAVLAVICLALYLVKYYGVFDTSVFYSEKSPIINAFYGLFDQFLVPHLETLRNTVGI